MDNRVTKPVSVINRQNKRLLEPPIALLIPTSFDRFSTSAVAKLIKLKQAAISKNNPITTSTTRFFLEITPPYNVLKCMSFSGCNL